MLTPPNVELKFWIVMPVSDEVYGSEGIPKAFPRKEDVEVFYTLEAAEKNILEWQQAMPHNGWVILEAVSTCARHHDRDVFSVVPTVAWF
jgi:hypothetical protein